MASIWARMDATVPPLKPPFIVATNRTSASSPAASCSSSTPRSDGMESYPHECTIRAPDSRAGASQRSTRQPDPDISGRLEGLTIRKIIVVKDRIVNIVAA